MSDTFVCRTEDVPENGMTQVDLEGKKVLVVNSGGEYYVFDAFCPHQEIPLCEGMFDGSVLTCHEHLWQWRVRDNEPVGLAEAPLVQHTAEVEEGEIYIVAKEEA